MSLIPPARPTARRIRDSSQPPGPPPGDRVTAIVLTRRDKPEDPAGRTGGTSPKHLPTMGAGLAPAEPDQADLGLIHELIGGTVQGADCSRAACLRN
jgi:hypothetical protein